MPFARGPVLLYIGGGQYRTVGASEYVGQTDVIHIPDGFPTDLATVPRVFWWLLPPTGVYERSAVVHDFGCVQLAEGTCLLSSRDVDGLFRRIAREGGAGFVTRWLLWTGVRWGALGNPHRRAGWWRDAPLVLTITALTLAAVAGATYLLDRLAHLVF